MHDDVRASQLRLCAEHGARFVESPLDMKVGISLNVRSGLMPINGLRHPIQGDTTGWFIWAGGEPSSAPDFFQPAHVAHLAEWCPLALKFLGLPPGWRFLVADGYEDVWGDPSLLDT
ncbi:hypothetical protein F0U59_32570 [Archangium gephyra]|nr:hypothetical protein F0U59_32570 [Archangium gephyra]